LHEVPSHHSLVMSTSRVRSSDSRSGNPDNSGVHSFRASTEIEDHRYDTGKQLPVVDRCTGSSDANRCRDWMMVTMLHQPMNWTGNRGHCRTAMSKVVNSGHSQP
jgi:hypothetical protein